MLCLSWKIRRGAGWGISSGCSLMPLSILWVAVLSPPTLLLFSVCFVSASARKLTLVRGGKSSTSKRKSVYLLLGQHTPTTLCVVYDHGVNQTERIKGIFSFTVRSSGLLKGRHSKDEHAGTKLHHYCHGCHLEVLVEKPAFYGIQHWTFHGLLPGRRLLLAASEIIFKFFIGNMD